MAPPPAEGDATASRINFRLPEQLKSRIEEAAAREGLSVNAWLIRVSGAAVQPAARPTTDRAPIAGQRYTGWAR
ncbi:hypothetical protein Asp14428_04170 [Actinoplanes sp. NBRC 14428]|nr:hypothetical protein Asp14428_04170 [Actinoplanes sp. NBRC 14428]